MPGKQLNPQYPVPQQQYNYIIISKPDRMKKSMEDSTPEWRIDPQRELSFPIDYKS